MSDPVYDNPWDKQHNDRLQAYLKKEKLGKYSTTTQYTNKYDYGIKRDADYIHITGVGVVFGMAIFITMYLIYKAGDTQYYYTNNVKVKKKSWLGQIWSAFWDEVWYCMVGDVAVPVEINLKDGKGTMAGTIYNRTGWQDREPYIAKNDRRYPPQAQLFGRMKGKKLRAKGPMEEKYLDSIELTHWKWAVEQQKKKAAEAKTNAPKSEPVTKPVGYTRRVYNRKLNRWELLDQEGMFIKITN